MSFSYTPGLTIPLNLLRFLLDDKEEEYRVYEDEELQYYLDKIGTYPPPEVEVKKVALKLLKKQLQELLRSPSRERAGQYEVYQASSTSLQFAIKDLEDEIENTLYTPSMYAGGVYKQDFQSNQDDPSLVQSHFERDHFFINGRC